jgi:hypothetical protein
MCDDCSVGGTELQCPKCRALTGAAFPFGRDNHDFSRLWDFALDAWKREWAMLSVGFIIVMGASMAAGLVGNIFSRVLQAMVSSSNTVAFIAVIGVAQLFVYVLQQMAVGVMQMGWARMAIDVLRGGRADVGRMFSQLSKTPAFLVQFLILFGLIVVPSGVYFVIATIAAIKIGRVELPSFDPAHADAREWVDALAAMAPVLGGATLLWLVPLVWMLIVVGFAQLEIVYGDARGWESIARSFTLTRGFRLPMLGYIIICVLVILVGTLLCCIGSIPAWALVELLMVTLYLALRNGSGLPPPPEP